MDALTIIIMLILFVLAMVFIFSTALLTPYLGKKNLISVILLGLVVGLVGGAFLLSPIVDDIPDFTRTIIEESVDGTDLMELDLSTNGNLTQIIQNISSISGVQNVSYEGIKIKIDENFTLPSDKNRLVTALNNSNENISSVDEIGEKEFLVRIKEGGDPQSVLTSIYKTFSTETYTHLRYTSMQANATITANNITKVMSAVNNNGAVILNVTGPTEDQIASVQKLIPDKTNVIIFSGILGVIIAIAGFFIDSIFTFTSKSKKKARKNISQRDKIKRKTVPRTFTNSNASKRNSIDIFDDSFDDSSKQTIGSNKNFKQISDDDLKSKNKDKSKSKSEIGKLSGLFGGLSNSNKKDKSNKEHSKRKAPKIRPKRKD